MNSSKIDSLVDRITAYYEEQVGKKHQQKSVIGFRRIIDIAIAYPLDTALVFYIAAATSAMIIGGILTVMM